MGAQFQRTVIVTTPGGMKVTLNDSDPITTLSRVTLQCDGPRCASHNKPEATTTLTWVEEEVGEDPLALPDEFARGIKVNVDPFHDKALWFCRPRCLKDYLDYVYVPPRSPREAAQDRAAGLPSHEAVEAAVGGLVATEEANLQGWPVLLAERK